MYLAPCYPFYMDYFISSLQPLKEIETERLVICLGHTAIKWLSLGSSIEL